MRTGFLFIFIFLGLNQNIFANEPTPLRPHPKESKQPLKHEEAKPVFSQDKYKKTLNHEAQAQDLELERIPVFSQDRFAKPEEPENLELRSSESLGREWGESYIAQGIKEYNSNRIDEAEKLFQKAQQNDPRNFIALEYFGVIEERRGKIHQALTWFVKAKHLAPKGRWGALNFHIARMYYQLKNFERFEVYMKLAIKGGGHLVASHYFLGYYYYTKKQYDLAEAHLYESKRLALKSNAKQEDKDLLQAISYYLGEIYSRSGYLRYAVKNLRETEYGPSWEVRSTAWRVHSEINKAQWGGSLGLFAQLDNNVVLLPIDAFLPIEYNSKAAFKNIFVAEGKYRSSEANSWIFGANGSGMLSYHWNASLGYYDLMSWSGLGYLSYWTRKDWSSNLKLNGNWILSDRSSFSTFQTQVLPEFSIEYFPFERWTFEFGFQYRINSFARDPSLGPDRRSSKGFALHLDAKLKNVNPKFSPKFSYQFLSDKSVGENFRAKSHVFSVDLDLHMTKKWTPYIGLQYAKTDYPEHFFSREDWYVKGRLGISFQLSSNWGILFDNNYIKQDSKLSDFKYVRMTNTLGATYSF